MSERYCLDADAVAPRDGCRCRECIRAREALLPEPLIKLANQHIDIASQRISFSCPVVYAAINRYLSGDLTMQEMQVALVVALAAQCDLLGRQLLNIEMLKSVVPNLFLTPEAPARPSG